MGGFNSGPWGSAVWNQIAASNTGVGVIQVQNLIYHAYRIAGVLARAGRGYSVSQYADGLWELNALIDEWQAQRTMVYGILRTVYNWTPNKQTYLVGQSGAPDINLPRPVQLDGAGYIFNNVTPSVEQPMKVVTPQLWENLSPKDLTSTIATHLYYQPTLPNGTLWLWPVPTVAYQGSLYTWQNIQAFVNATDTVGLPPAYRNAIVYNLAVRLALREPERAKISPQALVIAKEALQQIRSINAPDLVQKVETAGCEVSGGARGHWSIIANRYI